MSAGWIALGGFLKLLWGAPLDLPQLLHGIMWPDPAGFLSLIIAIELFVASLAFFSPRTGWRFVVALLTVFIVLSGFDWARGVATCGCFGGALPIPPVVVLLIDAALLASIIALGPWRSLADPARATWSASPALGALLVALLTIVMTTAEPPSAAALSSAGSTRPAHRPDPGQRLEERATSTAAIDEDQVESDRNIPASMPRFVVLQPSRWTGKRLFETELAEWTDVSRFPDDASIILYMDTCPHCRDLLSERAKSPGGKAYVLVRVPAPNPNFPVYVKDDVPAGMRIDLPRGTRWNIVVPWEVIVRGGVVERAEFHKRSP